MVCNDRQLTEAQRQAGFNQQRTGVAKALRPFTGEATAENLADYLNREVFPVLKQARDKLNEVFLQVTDNAPSGNPLAFYFSTETAAADPTVGRVRLNNATQDLSTIVRVSQSNGRLVDVAPWLDVMAGGPTTPLGTVTLFDVINPGRFIRWDLNTMTDQGAYWDLGVTVIESSHDNPFVDGEGVVIAFIPGVSAAGSTVPISALSPIADDTFLANIAGAPAAPAAVALATLAGAGLTGGADAILAVGAGTGITVNANDVQLTTIADDTFMANVSGGAAVATGKTFASLAGDGLAYDATAHELDVTGSTSITVTGDQVQRAALTGFAAAALNTNATTSAEPIVTYSASANMSAERVTTNSTSITVSTGVASQIEFQRAALTGAITAAANSNSTLFDANASGAGLTGGGTAILAVGAGAAITVNANDVAIDQSATLAWTGAHSFAHKFSLIGVYTATVNGTRNDEAIGNVSVVRMNINNTTTLTGMVAANDGQMIYLQNTSASFTLTISDEGLTSTAANRFAMPSTSGLVVRPNGGVFMRYDGTRARWLVADSFVDFSVSLSPTTHPGTRAIALVEGNGIDFSTSASSGTVTITAAVNASADFAWSGANTHAGVNTFNAAVTFNASTTLANTVLGTGVFSSTLAGTANDLAIGNVSIVRLSLTGSQNLTGMVTSAVGQQVWVFNADSADTLTLVHNSGLSSLGRQFLCPGNVNYALGPRTGVAVWRDTLSDFWLVLAN